MRVSKTACEQASGGRVLEGGGQAAAKLWSAERSLTPLPTPASVRGLLGNWQLWRDGATEEATMDNAISLRFESKLHVPTARVWEWITSVEGISAEMWPFFRMTTPKGIRSLSDVQIESGVRMFRSYVFLFGVLPIDYSDMTLVELDSGRGFVEESPMGSMKLWRHERRIVPCPSDPSAVLLVDQLTFRPRVAQRLVGWFIRRVFIHRHEVLRTSLGGA